MTQNESDAAMLQIKQLRDDYDNQAMQHAAIRAIQNASTKTLERAERAERTKALERATMYESTSQCER